MRKIPTLKQLEYIYNGYIDKLEKEIVERVHLGLETSSFKRDLLMLKDAKKKSLAHGRCKVCGIYCITRTGATPTDDAIFCKKHGADAK